MRGGIGVRWLVALDGAAWTGLFAMSGLSLFDRMHAPWMLLIAWFALHPGVMLAYLAAKWSLHYPRYVWAVRGWTLTTSWLWLFQSALFVHHIATEGFFAPLGHVDSGSAAIASAVALYAWFDAFWAELVQPYPLIPLRDASKAVKGE